MPFQLTFTQREKYSSLAPGISVDTILRAGELLINCQAQVDTALRSVYSKELLEKLSDF